MPTFPTYGTLLARGYGEQPQPNMLRTEMEGGVPKQRPRSSLQMVQRPVVYRFTSANYQNFRDWVRDTINNGADWFDWTDPRTSTVKQARMVGGQYDGRPVNSVAEYWNVSFTLETRE